ncbi:RcpC/CpaB family pilus assembly protein [Streptomyces qinglanensis]|uniref:RcpC/CpaB family pilus assembly protein n=1 Tax=Streptomyces qinglanensis TaxID=943816 RepID=UPI001EF9A437|nr:RcpC/CpaB family pilus assembly protein [Streptomyces qinglanensis]
MRTVTGGEAGEAPVSVPVRIADAATVRLLSPGDRIDVLASTSKSTSARVVATQVRVAQVPEDRDTVSGGGADGALIVVVVPRRTAAALAGAAAKSRLAVTLC